MTQAKTTLRDTIAALALAGLMTGATTSTAQQAVGDFTTPDDVLAKAFSKVQEHQVPTGILLERGALWGGDAVRESDGVPPAGKPGEASEVRQAYMDLRRGAYTATLPSHDMLNAAARPWREERRATPISLMIIDYDTLAGQAEPTEIDGVLQLPEGRLGETRRFVGADALVDAVYSWTPDFVIPSELLVLNGIEAEAIDGIEVMIGDAPPQEVRLDVPFRAAWLPEASGVLPFSVSIGTPTGKLTTTGEVNYLTPKTKPTRPPTDPPTTANPRTPPVPCTTGLWPAEGTTGTENVRFYDVGNQVIGLPFVAPWNEPFQILNAGRLNIRVIPAERDHVSILPDTGECDIELLQPVVVVDGIDVFNIRTQDTILQDFGGTIKKMHDLGFDVIVVDYTNGRDWIERNGRALMQLMTNDIKDFVNQDVLDEQGVAIVAGSMGTQVTRWGLMEAEDAGLDHHTELFVSIDGPYFGANIPIGFQRAAVDLGSLTPVAATFRAALEAPAPSQLMVRTFPRGAGMFDFGWYAPRPEFSAFFNDASALGGLPSEPRNVAASNGSGTGSLQTSLGSDVRLLRAEGEDGGFGWKLKFHVEVRSDGPGAKIYERDQCFKIIGIPTNCSSISVTQNNGFGLDVAAGGFRLTTLDFIAGVGPTVEVNNQEIDVDYSFDLNRHAFVPTPSAFGAEIWDNRTWEKCNTQHASPTPTAVGLVLSELVAFRDGVIPPPAPLFSNPCNQPEPVENCFPGVIWYSDPDNPFYIQPWDDGANCFVTPQPGGFTAEVEANSYAVQPDSLSCFDGSQPGPNGCLYSTVTAQNALGASFPLPGVLHIEVWTNGIGGGPWTCPANTFFSQVISMDPDPIDIVECVMISLPGVPAEAFTLSGFDILVPPAQSCGIGIPLQLNNEFLCYLGTAPIGTSAFKWGGAFYYEGWD